MKKALLCVSVSLSLFTACVETPEEVGADVDFTACVPTDAFLAIDRHVLDLVSTAGALAGHPSQAEATGFMLAPALPAPPALAASFAGPLVMTCSEPLVYDAFCEEGRCSQLECTGRGAGWRNHLWIEEPVESKGWSIESVDVSLVWEDGATVTSFTIETQATAPHGTDASMIAAGTMDVDGLTVVEQFPRLHPYGAATLEYADDEAGLRGRIVIDGVVTAEVDDDGSLVPTGECP
jgi:hypothetical protein